MHEREYTTDLETLRSAWQKFIQSGKVPQDLVRPEVVESWQSCRSLGIDPYSQEISAPISDNETARRLTSSAALINAARPFMQSLFSMIKSFDAVTFLTDADGFILDMVGEALSRDYCQAKKAVVGSSLSEKYAGTSSVVIALRHDRPFQMFAGEQYCEANHIASCAAAPIHRPDGRIAGCITITGPADMNEKMPHIIGMVATAAGMIESQLKSGHRQDKALSIHTGSFLKATMNSISSGIILVDNNGIISAINPQAEKMFGISRAAASERQLSAIIHNEAILDAVAKRVELKDQEIVILESLHSPRCLTSVQAITTAEGQNIGSIIRLQEMESINRMARKMAGCQAQYTFDNIKGNSPQIKHVIAIARQIADSPSTVLIRGESGTGKEIMAQSIHNAGSRSNGPFFAINCAAIPHDLIESELFGYEPGTFTGASKSGKPGKLELAEGGTLFLDEVDGMSLHMQAKLLRVLEEKKFLRLGGTKYCYLDTRIIAATNKNLNNLVEQGSFRSDLYYRLNVLEIHIPPLRERNGDIELLISLFIRQLSAEIGKNINGIHPDALAYLRSRQWQGNVRELRNWIERAVNLAPGAMLMPGDFPSAEGFSTSTEPQPVATETVAESRTWEEMERDAIIKSLQSCRGNIAEAARSLGIGRSTLYRKMKKYNIRHTLTVSSGDVSD